MTNFTSLSPAARAVLEVVTWKKYDVPPEGLPAFAEEIAPLIATALRAAADQLGEKTVVHREGFKGVTQDELSIIHVDDLLVIADELDSASVLEPNDLSYLTEEEFQSLAPQGYHAP